MRGNTGNPFLYRVFTLFLFLIVFFPCIVNAQSRLQSWTSKPEVSFEFYHPELMRSNHSGLTSLSFFSFKYPIEYHLLVDFDIPFAYNYSLIYHKNHNIPTTVYKEFSPGNPYIGVTFDNPENPVTVDFGLRLPTIFEVNYHLQNIGNATSFYRYNSMVGDLITFSLKANYHGKFSQSLFYQLYLGGIAEVNFGYGDYNGFLVPYGFLLRYLKKQTILGGGISALLNTSGNNFSNKIQNMVHLYLEGGINASGWSPNLYLALPIDKNSGRLLHWIIGFRITIYFKGVVI